MELGVELFRLLPSLFDIEESIRNGKEGFGFDVFGIVFEG